MKNIFVFVFFFAGVLHSFSQNIQTPGVYVEEVSVMPQSIAQVETAIPAFIGFTEKGISFQPVRISSMAEYISTFGSACTAQFSVELYTGAAVRFEDNLTVQRISEGHFYLNYGLQQFFDNGGGSCYIVSTGIYSTKESTSIEKNIKKALDEIEKVDEVTLLVFPDALSLPHANYYSIVNYALQQCAKLKDRFTLIDIHPGDQATVSEINSELKTGNKFRNTALENSNLKYGAVYTPYLNTMYSHKFSESDIQVKIQGQNGTFALNDPAIMVKQPKLYQQIKDKLENEKVVMPPSPAIAGIYARVDNNRGVWKAPANVVVNSVSSPTIKISNQDQDMLNVDPVTGKSINAIRTFPGAGILVWGSRSLAGNDNEWRYVPACRFYMVVEESIKKGTSFAVFEPNDANTWQQVEGIVENYLNGLWRDGALTGAKPDDAFFVKVGLGSTMTQQDIIDGKLIIEIGMAMVRPAEFTILRITHQVQGK